MSKDDTRGLESPGRQAESASNHANDFERDLNRGRGVATDGGTTTGDESQKSRFDPQRPRPVFDAAADELAEIDEVEDAWVWTNETGQPSLIKVEIDAPGLGTVALTGVEVVKYLRFCGARVHENGNLLAFMRFRPDLKYRPEADS